MKKEKSYKKSLSFRFSLLLMGTLFLVGLLWSGIISNQEKENKNYLLQSTVMGPISQDHIQQVGQNLAAKDKPGSVTHLSVGKIDAEKFKTKDGKEGWRVSIPGGRALATPAVYKDVVYVGGGFGSYEFYAFDSSNGHPRWAIKVSDDGPTAAVVAEDKVVFNTESCTLFVVDAKTGKHIWSKWLGDPLMSQPAVAGGNVFMAFPGKGGHKLIALGLMDGKEKWQSSIVGDIISAPVIYNDSVYLSTFDGTVYCFRINDGKETWKKKFQATSAPWLYKDQVYVSKRESGEKDVPYEGIARMENLKGIQNQETGIWGKRKAPYIDQKVQTRSSYNAAQKKDDASVGFSNAPDTAKVNEAASNVGQATVRGLWEYQGSRPCIIKNRLFLTQGDQLMALNPNSGKQIWLKKISGDLEKLGGHLAAPPSPAGKNLYLATVTGKILVVSQKKGRVVEIIDIGEPMRFQPAIVNGRLFVGTANGKLICIKLKDQSADGWPMWGGGPTHNGL